MLGLKFFDFYLKISQMWQFLLMRLSPGLGQKNYQVDVLA
jgi:hypothetical protein